MPPHRKKREYLPGCDRLEGRDLPSGGWGAVAMAESLPWMRADSTAKEGAASVSEQDARAEDKGKTIKRARVTIYGVVMPALTVTKGKTRGAAIVATDVVWLLDLTAVKGLSNYARGLLHQPVAAIGSAEITDEGGVLKRKLKVNWMEPLQDPDVPPPILNRNGRGLSQYFPVSRGGK